MQMRLRFIKQNDGSFFDKANYIGGNRYDEPLPRTQPLEDLIAVIFAGNKFAACFLAEKPNDKLTQYVVAVFALDSVHRDVEHRFELIYVNGARGIPQAAVLVVKE